MSSKDATKVLAANSETCRMAACALARGELVALPTETVYGLAARADREEAVAQIFAAKGRPSFNPLIVHVRDAAHARRYAVFTDVAERLAKRFWPGPLTLVLPKLPGAELAPAVSAGLPTIAMRCPAHPVMREVLELCDFSLAAPSANRSGGVSPTSAAHVKQGMGGRIQMVVDGGASQAGIESTIVAVRENGSIEELRPGPITMAEIGKDHAKKLRGATSACRIVEAPGMTTRHYAPGKPMRLRAMDASSDEFHIGFGTITGHRNLSPNGNLEEAAHDLYAALHEAARSSRPRIAVAPIPDEGAGKAINDRLRRAAA